MKKTLAEGYKLTKDAVYRYKAPDPRAHLSLARVAFKVGDVDEARKNIRKYLARRPASARAVVEAFAIVNEFSENNLSFRDWLDTRRLLLDPSGFLTIK